MNSGTRRIVHVDMDSFFASVEQRDDPSLRGRPVAVGRDGERGVLAAASYEARRFGVRSAMSSAAARRLCGDLVIVPPRFEAYRAVSAEIRGIFLEWTPLVEPVSLDEAYLDLTENLKGVRWASAAAREIRAEILAQTCLTSSAGISYNRFLAKTASDVRKPNGQYTITPEAGPAFVAGLSIEKFHGIGPVTAARMRSLGIRSGADLREQPEDFLIRHFGKAGSYFFRIARGCDDRPVVPDRPRKSSGSETTFREDISDPGEAEAEIARLAGDVWAWREQSGTGGRTVSVKIRFSDFREVTRSRTFPAVIASRQEFEAAAAELLRSVFPLARPVRLLGVTLSNLEGARAGAGKQMGFGF